MAHRDRFVMWAPFSVAESGADTARSAKERQVQRNQALLSFCIFQRNVGDGYPFHYNKAVSFSCHERISRRSAELSGEDPVRCYWRAAAQHMAERDCAGFDTGFHLDLISDFLSYSSESDRIRTGWGAAAGHRAAVSGG